MKLHIHNPTQDDVGSYTCSIANASKEPIDEITHHISARSLRGLDSIRPAKSIKEKSQATPCRQPISFESFLKNMTIEDGTTTKFICSIRGPFTSAIWTRDGQVITTTDRFLPGRTEGLVYLEIKNTNPSDSGNYSVLVSNNINEMSSNAQLNVYPSPRKRTKELNASSTAEKGKNPADLCVTRNKICCPYSLRAVEAVSHPPSTQIVSAPSSSSSTFYRDMHHTRAKARLSRAVTPYRSYESDATSNYDSTKHFQSTSLDHHHHHHQHHSYAPSVSEYDYLRRPFSPSRECPSSRYSRASAGRAPSTFQHPSPYRSAIDCASAQRSFDSSLQATRTNIRSRHRTTADRYNMTRSKSANPSDRLFKRTDLYCASNLDSNYRPSTYDRYDRYELYSKRPLYNPRVMERRVTQNSDIKLMHNVMADDASIKWFRNDKELAKSSRCRSVYREGLAMLEIFSAQLTDTAKYTCVARNKLGYSSFSSHLKVFPDTITEPLPPIFTRAMKGRLIYVWFVIFVCMFCTCVRVHSNIQKEIFYSSTIFPKKIHRHLQPNSQRIDARMSRAWPTTPGHFVVERWRFHRIR